MASTRETGLGLDHERLLRLAISISNDRDRYFQDLIRKFREHFSGIKLIYANDRTGAVLKEGHPMPDFMIVGKALKFGDPKMPPQKMVVFDAPMIFSDRSIAGWIMAVEAGNMKGYFQYMNDKMVTMPESVFCQGIVEEAKLSLNKNDPLFWKRPENEETLAKNLSEWCAKHRKKGSTKMQDQQGYVSQTT